MTTRISKMMIAGASAIALSVAGLSASAQSFTAKQDAAVTADDLAMLQLKSDTSVSIDTTTDKTWKASAATWNAEARVTLDQCRALMQECTALVDNAAGVLVFPELTSASFVVGGTGGRGVLMVDGEPVGYYTLAAGSLGFQAGIEKVSQVMTFNTEEALADLVGSPEWRTGADANITVIATGANAQAIADGDFDSLGQVSAIAFNQEGLAGGIAIEGVRLSAITEKTIKTGHSY